MASASLPAPAPGRAELLKTFEESRTGVRGLVESGVSSVPEIFRHPNPYASIPLAPPSAYITVVDLSLPFPAAAAAAASAARSWGFFHLVNYHRALPQPAGGGGDGVGDYPARAITAVRAFNELPAAERAPHYSRAVDGGVNYSTNVDLYNSPAASWRDTIQVMLGPNRRSDLASRIPAVCRDEMLEWEARATVMGLLSEGLGLGVTALEEASCVEGKVLHPPTQHSDSTCTAAPTVTGMGRFMCL